MALTYNQLDAITTKSYIPALIDNVFDTNQVMKKLQKEQKIKSGGTSIMAPVINSTSTSSGYYSDYDELDVSATENLTSAEVQWRQLYESIRIARSEILKNSGDAQKLSLIQSKMEIAQMSMQEKFALGIFSDGTAATGALTTKQFDGFGAILSATSTYAGIAVADMATWIAQIKSNSGTDRALSLPLLQNAVGAATFDGAKPTFLSCLQSAYDELWSLFQPHQRLVSKDMAALGFENVLTFNGLPVLVDSHNTSGEIIGIDGKHVNLCVHKDENMRKDDLKSLETSNTILTKIYYMGNIVCNSRRSNFKLSDIAVS